MPAIGRNDLAPLETPHPRGAGARRDRAATKAVVPPLHVATTFIRDPDNQYRTGYAYGRPDNATVRQTEAVIAALEGAHEALLFALRHGGGDRGRPGAAAPAHIVAPQVMYWALRHWLANEAPRVRAIEVDSSTSTDLDAVRAAIRPGKTEAGLGRDAGQPALDDHRHRGDRRDRARGRRAARRRLDRRDAGADAAAARSAPTS